MESIISSDAFYKQAKTHSYSSLKLATQKGSNFHFGIQLKRLYAKETQTVEGSLPKIAVGSGCRYTTTFQTIVGHNRMALRWWLFSSHWRCYWKVKLRWLPEAVTWLNHVNLLNKRSAKSRSTGPKMKPRSCRVEPNWTFPCVFDGSSLLDFLVSNISISHTSTWRGTQHDPL